MISKIGVQDWLKFEHNLKKDQGSKILSGMNSSSNDLKFLICHLQTYKKEISKNDGPIFLLKNIFWGYVCYTHGLEDYQNGGPYFWKDVFDHDFNFLFGLFRSTNDDCMDLFTRVNVFIDLLKRKRMLRVLVFTPLKSFLPLFFPSLLCMETL